MATPFPPANLRQDTLPFAAANRAPARLDGSGTRAVETLVAAIQTRHDEPDAGIWEFENRRGAHSRLICTAGLRAVTEHPLLLESAHRLGEAGVSAQGFGAGAR